MRSCSRLLHLLRVVKQQLQQQDQLAGLHSLTPQLGSRQRLYLSSIQTQALQQQLWAEQQAWRPQQEQQCPGIGQSPWLTRRPSSQHGYANHRYLQTQRAYAAAAPARAIAETMADVAMRKLADVQRQYDGLQAKMEGASAGESSEHCAKFIYAPVGICSFVPCMSAASVAPKPSRQTAAQL